MKLYRILADESYGSEQVLVFADDEEQAFKYAENYVPPREYNTIEVIPQKPGLLMTAEISKFGSHIDFYK